MTESEQVLTAGMALPREERRRVAKQLLASVSPDVDPDDSIPERPKPLNMTEVLKGRYPPSLFGPQVTVQQVWETEEQRKNDQIARTIQTDFAWNGQTFNEGECVVLLDGEVVAVCANLTEAGNRLRKLDPDCERGMLVPVEPPTVGIVR